MKVITLDCGHKFNTDYEAHVGDYNVCDRCGSTSSLKYRYIVSITGRQDD